MLNQKNFLENSFLVAKPLLIYSIIRSIILCNAGWTFGHYLRYMDLNYPTFLTRLQPQLHRMPRFRLLWQQSQIHGSVAKWHKVEEDNSYVAFISIIDTQQYAKNTYRTAGIKSKELVSDKDDSFK